MQRKQSRPKKHGTKDDSFDGEKNVLKEVTLQSDIEESNSSFLNNANNSYERDEDFLDNDNVQNNVPDKSEKKMKSKTKRKKKTKKKRESGNDEVAKSRRCTQERRLECDYCPEVYCLRF